VSESWKVSWPRSRRILMVGGSLSRGKTMLMSRLRSRDPPRPVRPTCSVLTWYVVRRISFGRRRRWWLRIAWCRLDISHRKVVWDGWWVGVHSGELGCQMSSTWGLAFNSETETAVIVQDSSPSARSGVASLVQSSTLSSQAKLVLLCRMRPCGWCPALYSQ